MKTRHVPTCRIFLLTSSLVLAAPDLCAWADELPEVPVARPVVREVADHEVFTGRIDAAVKVDVRARVSGYLSRANCPEGGKVEQGEELFRIDPTPYRLELERAEAGLQLAQARVHRARAVLRRATALEADRVISKEEVDRAADDVAEEEARLRAAEATRDLARLNLDFTHVVAPIRGLTGRRHVDTGNLVKADETLLVTIVGRNPMHLHFDVDERTYLRLHRLLADDRHDEHGLEVAFQCADENGFPHRAQVDFTDTRVDADTGSLRMRALVMNKDGRFIPGMFARVRMTLGKPHRVLLLPTDALQVGLGQPSVFVVNDQDAIESRLVKIGPELEGRRIITEGLQADDRVVVGRLQGLRSGDRVRPIEPGRKEKAPPSPPSSQRTGWRFPASAPGPVILVQTSYPGASAGVVADTVAAPIEEQVNGVEKMLSLRSRCTSDGEYSLAVTFAHGADPKISQVLVQNRVALALPVLPEAVAKVGVDTRRGTEGLIAVLVLTSPTGKYDALYLSNYARIQLKDELARLAGIGAVHMVGKSDYGLRIWLDSEKLSARSLTASDVARALTEQKVQLRAGVRERPERKQGTEAELLLAADGRLSPEEFANIIVKAGSDGQVVRLRDVARIELGASRAQSEAFLDGKPAAVLVLEMSGNARARALRDTLRDMLADLRSRLPDGLDLAIRFDLHQTPQDGGAASQLRIDLDLPAAISRERILKLLERSQRILAETPGVRGSLALTENPFGPFAGVPCILVDLRPARTTKEAVEETVGEIRRRLDAIQEMAVRLCPLSPETGYPFELAVSGPEASSVRSFAAKLGHQLRQSKLLTDVGVSSASQTQVLQIIDIDREKAHALGVKMQDLFDTLEVYLGSCYVNDFNRFGRTWQVTLSFEPGSGKRLEDLRDLKVRTAQGQMVRLGTLIAFRQTDAPLAIDRLNVRPMVEITANLAADTPAEEVRKRSEALADEVRKELHLGADYRVTWLRPLPGPAR